MMIASHGRDERPCFASPSAPPPRRRSATIRPGLARQDYYSEGQEITGVFHGKAAERLKLPRKVTAEIFAALTENRDPATGETLTARQKENRRSGYDSPSARPRGRRCSLR